MSSRVFGHDLGHVFFQPGSHGAKRPSCGSCAGFVQGVQQSVRGVQQGAGNRIDFSFFDFSESPRGLSALQKFPNGLFISIHFP